MNFVIENLHTALSKLESQVVRNPDLPKFYAEVVTEGFTSLWNLQKAIEQMQGPWRVGGHTEDGLMWCLYNAKGYEVARVYTKETAELLVALSSL